MSKRNWIWTLLVTLNGVLMAWFIGTQLLDSVPVHYNLMGAPDRWSSRWWLLLFACLPIVMALGYALYEHLNRNARNAAANRKYTASIVPLISLLMLAMGWGIAVQSRFQSQQLDVRNTGWVFIALGLVMVYISNIMGKIKPNRTLGIKIPWTLRDDEVWYRTHRMAGYWGVVGGLMMMLGGIIGMALGVGWAISLAVAGLLLLIVPPFIYAYRLYYIRHPK